MNSHIRNMMAQMESWEAATEFAIPEADWAEYLVRKRSDDLYIACLASVFDALRLANDEAQSSELAALAQTLLIYSRSTAARYLRGVEKNLNNVYAAALYYLAGFPATAMLIVKNLASALELTIEEAFLYGFLERRLKNDRPVEHMLANILGVDASLNLEPLCEIFREKISSGLMDDPRKFIASKLSLACIQRFKSTNVWDALREYSSRYAFELWRPFLNNENSYPLWELLPSQLTAIRTGILSDNDEPFSLQMPTSAGKTALCELLIYHEVKARNKQVLFLVPFRALAAEILHGMSQRLKNAGIRIIATYGGNIPTRSETDTLDNVDVLIVTPEKFVALAQVLPDLESRFQTVICDEGHLIDDEGRGLQYELLLTKLRGTPSNPRKIVFISAILPNVNEIHSWLGGNPGRMARSTYRPVETDYAFLTQEDNNSWWLDVNPIYERPRSYYLRRFLVKDEFRYVNPVTGHQKLISGWKNYTSLACAAALKARRSGAVALFTTSRGMHGVSGLAQRLIAMCETGVLVASQNAPMPSEEVTELQEFIGFLFGQEYLLTRLLVFRIGFHHGMLPQEVRRVMEEYIQNGVINILICTTTLAEGVNLPIRTLVMHTVRRYDPINQAWSYLHNRTIKNIIGRVGRAGKETRGRVIFINDTERSQLNKVLRNQEMEPAQGALYQLIKAINDYVAENNVSLSNDFFDQVHDPKFLSMIDNIDFTLLDLIPTETPQYEINRHIDELLEGTLAQRYCVTAELRTCLQTLFRIRAMALQETVHRDAWPVLRKSGVSPRFWKFVIESDILEHDLWTSLENPIDDVWLEEVIVKLLDFSAIDVNVSPDILLRFVRGWMSGATYSELAIQCGYTVDEVLEILCNQVGYRLQNYVAKLCQLAMERYGENVISEVARNWSSLLQYGLGSMQQLDIFEQGVTDRLAAWGVFRFLLLNN
ncbi:MAG: DEAD/DEAH box helicase, partial [Candidatus Omnitrophica bacterium]|nr:DEAD/DEAH box helicase [Candidatus Omnitrophota bacterium]